MNLLCYIFLMCVVVRVRVLREEKLEGAFFDWIFVLANDHIIRMYNVCRN